MYDGLPYDPQADEITQLIALKSGRKHSGGDDGNEPTPRLLARPQLPTLDSGGAPTPVVPHGAPLSSGAQEAAAASVAAARQRALSELAAAQAKAIAGTQLDLLSGGTESRERDRGGDSSGGSSGAAGSAGSTFHGDFAQPEGGPAEDSFPFGMVSAINTVLYERHGYTHMQRHGDPM